ncbi:MAG: hypothetical protein M1820_007790 [Bogoriella megaspora]|nr:MAG: hypothetical protein M1820_007790 [Bogoriella megaspora]
MISDIAAVLCLLWYLAVTAVCIVGWMQIVRHFSCPAAPAGLLAQSNIDEAPHVTIIRPVKGPEPNLHECLAATFRQTYPKQKLSVRFCVASRRDVGVPIVLQLLAEFPQFDAQLLVEDEDPALQDSTTGHRDLGPNPKIRNMSRAYRESRGDIVWIIDCNVWVGPGVLGRMVELLCGKKHQKYKFVHQLPIVVDVSTGKPQANGLPSGRSDDHKQQSRRPIFAIGGGRLEEVFMTSSHAKFYTAINTVLIAPCIVGKSTMFRRSHLDALTLGSDLPPGIDYFSVNICEDHLIGDLLWKKQVPGESDDEKWGKHAMLFGDLAVQPMMNITVQDYIARRIRWLRVRKFTVTLATLVEPGTESFLCSLYGAYAFTSFSCLHGAFGLPPTWATFWAFWVLSVSLWTTFDRLLYVKLHSGSSIEIDEQTPEFARPTGGQARRPFGEWLVAWIGRETLAFPIWFIAFFAGVTVDWRGKKFWVGTDMRVHTILERDDYYKASNGSGSSQQVASTSKLRLE